MTLDFYPLDWILHNPAEFIGTVTGVAGALMLALKCRFAAWAWPLWIVSTIAWILQQYQLEHPAYGFIFQQIVFGVINIIGTWNWFFKKQIIEKIE